MLFDMMLPVHFPPRQFVDQNLHLLCMVLPECSHLCSDSLLLSLGMSTDKLGVRRVHIHMYNVLLWSLMNK